MNKGLDSRSNQSLFRYEYWALVLVFLVAFIPRVLYPVSRPLQWYDRSARFVRAVLHGDLQGTLFSEHPGVTVMWLSGGAQWGWYGLRSLVDPEAPRPLETPGYAFVDRVGVGIWPLALAVSLGILWGWRLLARLFGRRVAWLSAWLWALNPFYLANSKTLHLDALLSTLMILSALHLLLYVRDKGRKDLVGSGLLGGLALLTKSSAIFLVPYVGLGLLVGWMGGRSLSQMLAKFLDALLRPMLIWLLVAVAIYVLLWPSLWVQPGASWDVIYRKGFVLHASSTRDLPIFYRGVVGYQDPGPRFYLDVLGFRSTFFTLPFALVGAATPLARGRNRRSLILLLGFVFFFFIQMSLGQWKDGRYMLPVLLVMDVLAAVGLLWWAEGIARRLSGAWARHFVRLVVGALLLLQGWRVLSHHPYYGNHYNFLLGEMGAARRVFALADFGEGLDRAGRYVDRMPDATEATVATQFLANEMLAQYVRADITEVTQIDKEVDYVVFGVQYTSRSRDFPRWGGAWDDYKYRPPAYVARLEGLPFAWVYAAGAPTSTASIPHRVEACLGPMPDSDARIHLLGYRLEPEQAAPGDSLWLTLYWQADGAMGGDYTVFSHVIGPDGELVAQQDNPPVRGTRPTSTWAAGELIEDPYELRVPEAAPPGDYSLSVGMYDPVTGQRLAALTADGTPLPDNRVVLTDLPVRPVVAWPQRALAVGWLLVIGIGCGVSAWPRQPGSGPC